MRACVAMAAAAAGLGACWQPPHAADGTVAIPGAIWTTPAKAWRYPGALSQLVPDGRTALALMSGREIVRVDLGTGRLLATHVYPDFALSGLLHLHDGRWLVTGAIGGGFAAAVLEPDTLALTMLPLRGHRNAVSSRQLAGQLADGRVVLAGPGLPFAAYDPHSWVGGPPIAELVGYPTVVIERDSVLVMRLGKAVRYSPAGGLGTDLKTVANIPVASANGVIASRVSGAAGPSATVATPDGKTLALPAPVEHVALSADGARVATLGDGVLRVVRIADGAELRRVVLGDSGRGAPASFVLEDARVILTLGAALRVVDLATGAVTPDGGPPYSPVRAVAVANDGRVTAIGSHAWTFAPDGGALHEGAALGDRTVVQAPLGEVTRYVALAKGEPSALEIHDVTTGEITHRTPLETGASDAYLGPDGEAIVAETTSPPSLWRTAHGALARVMWLTDAAMLDDADPTTGLALLSVGGEANLVRMRDAAVLMGLPFPGCDPYGSAGLERGGRRLYTLSDDDLEVWDRTTGDLVASLHAPPSPFAFDATFVPGHDELLLGHGRELELWSLADGTLRSVPVGSMFWSAVSPDGKRAALVLMDGRTALLDLDVIRAALPGRPVAAASEQKTCVGGDPTGTPPPTPEGYDQPMGNDGWDGTP